MMKSKIQAEVTKLEKQLAETSNEIVKNTILEKIKHVKNGDFRSLNEIKKGKS